MFRSTSPAVLTRRHSSSPESARVTRSPTTCGPPSCPSSRIRIGRYSRPSWRRSRGVSARASSSPYWVTSCRRDALFDFINGCHSTERAGSHSPSRPRRRRRSPHRGISPMSDQSEPRAPQSPPAEAGDGSSSGPPRPKRRRGSRGGRNRNRNRTTSPASSEGVELPDRPSEGRPTLEAAEKALVRKPQIGDSRPAPADDAGEGAASPTAPKKRRRRGGRGRGSGGGAGGGGGGGGGGQRQSGSPVRAVLV